MNLLRKNNLFDVYDIDKARNNLLMKNIALQNNTNVNITGGNITIDSFRLKNYDSTNDRFLQCTDEGEIVLHEEDVDTIPSWLRYNQEDIAVTIFQNDINVVRYSSLCNVATNSDYNGLENKPYLWDYVNSNDFCVDDSNLDDIYRINEIFRQLGLNEYSRCNITNDMTFENIEIKSNVKITNLLDSHGLLDISFKNTLILDSIPRTSVLTQGLGILRNQPLASTDISTSYFLNSIYEELYSEYTSKNTEYVDNVNRVIDYIRSNQEDFVSFNNNLGDVDREEVISRLELDKLRDKVIVNDDNIDFTDLTVEFVYPSIYKNLKTTKLIDKFYRTYIDIPEPILQDNRNYYVFMHINKELNGNDYINLGEDIDLKYISTEYADYSYASEDKIGIIRLHESINDENRYETLSSMNINGFINVTETHLQDMDTLVDLVDFTAFLEELYQTGVDNGSNLMKFSCNLEEIAHLNFARKLKCYENLQLEPIVYDPDYNRLYNKPNFLSCFSNDCEFLSKYRNLNEFVELDEKENVRNALQVGTLGLQNIENVEMYGTDMNFDFLTIRDTLRFDNNPLYDEDNEYYVFGNEDGYVEWRRLPEYDDRIRDVKGITNMFNEMLYDDNGTYTIGLLKRTYDELSDELRQLKDELRDIKEHQNFLEYLN